MAMSMHFTVSIGKVQTTGRPTKPLFRDTWDEFRKTWEEEEKALEQRRKAYQVSQMTASKMH